MAKKFAMIAVLAVVASQIWLPSPAMAQSASLARMPLADYFYISQDFGAFHPGIDIAAQLGEPIHPLLPGTIVKAEKDYFGYGNLVIVAHGHGYESWYAHLSRIEVQTGQDVTSDTVLGLVGITGHSTGPHLHLELHLNGVPIDPRPILGIK